MVDSVSVAVGGEVAAWITDVVVVQDAGGEGEQAQRDADADAAQGSSAVGVEGELALAGPDDRFDPLADGPEGAVAVRSSRRSGLRKCAPRAAMICSNSSPAKPLSAMTM